MTTAQLRTIHVARRQVFGNDDAPYRLLLRNTAGVESSKHLTNATFEDVMAVLEDCGFRDIKGDGYWRRKVSGLAGRAGARMVHKIHELAKDSRYQLPALCRRVSRDRADVPANLHPKEAWNLIEMLKASTDREASSQEPVEIPSHFTDDIPF